MGRLLGHFVTGGHHSNLYWAYWDIKCGHRVLIPKLLASAHCHLFQQSLSEDASQNKSYKIY